MRQNFMKEKYLQIYKTLKLKITKIMNAVWSLILWYE